MEVKAIPVEGIGAAITWLEAYQEDLQTEVRSIRERIPALKGEE